MRRKGGVWESRSFLESFRLSTYQRRIKGYGTRGVLGAWGWSLIPLSQTPIYTIHSPKVALCPCTSARGVCAWTWKICLISDTYHILRLRLLLCHPPSDNPLLLCEIPPRSALSLNKHAFTQGQIITIM